MGMMGAVADAALGAGGEVLGVIPKKLMDLELGHRGCTELFVVDGMHARKAKMAELSDAFIALPGGFGTPGELLGGQRTWFRVKHHSLRTEQAYVQWVRRFVRFVVGADTSRLSAAYTQRKLPEPRCSSSR